MPRPTDNGEPDDVLGFLVCEVCQGTLAEVGTLYGCYACRQVRMCERHIGGFYRLEGGLRRPLCAACARVPS